VYTRLAVIAALGLAASIGRFTPASASSVVTFTWDPALASPPLTGAGSAINADNISLTNYLHSVNTNDFATLRQNFVEQFIQPITGFTLHGSPVSAPGLNSSYGLYFTLNATGHFPIDASGATTGPATFDSLSMTLMADVNHDDGMVGATLTGVGFSNAAGVANDVVLATGSLLSAALSRDAQGVRHAHFVETFVPDAAEEAFFVDPNLSLGWEEFLTTLPVAFQVTQVDALTTVQMVNGDLGSTGQVNLVPEPHSFGLLLGGCIALAAAMARRHRSPEVGAASA
jgi:hypothetical protein